MNVLSKELKRYKKALPELLQKHEGQYVLIHKNEILGQFDEEMEAVGAGYDKVGNVPFLVKRILEKDPVYVIGSQGE